MYVWGIVICLSSMFSGDMLGQFEKAWGMDGQVWLMVPYDAMGMLVAAILLLR